MIKIVLTEKEAEALGRLVDAAMRLGGIKVAGDVETFWGKFDAALKEHAEDSEK